MQWHNDAKSATLHERDEQTEYMSSSRYYGSSSGPTFQQQTYYSPMPDYGPASYSQRAFANTAPYSASRFAAVLSYSVGWLTGLLLLLFGSQNRFVRFHALQALVFFGAINLLDVGLLLIMTRGWENFQSLLVVCVLLFLLLNLIAFVGWVIGMIQAARGLYFKLPFVGELVASCFDQRTLPRW